MPILDAVVFYTHDIPTVVDYCTDKIGLELEYVSGEQYASFLFENGAKLGIKKASEEREIPGSQTLFIAVQDAGAEFERAKQEGLNIYKELTDEEWAIEFSVLDPDGNKVEYVQNR